MTPAVRSVLLDPHDAFASDREPSLLAPLLVVVAYGAVALATVAPVLVAVAELLPVSAPVAVSVGSEQVSAPGIPVAIVALGIPGLLVIWTIVALVTFGLARAIGGDGDLLGTVAFVGWGFLPKLLGALALGAVVLVAATLDPDATFIEMLVGSRGEFDVGVFSISGPGGTLFPIVALVELVATVWTAYVWYGGLRGQQALSRRRGIVLAVVLFLLFNGI
jgi:hypothetical protein